MFLQGQTQELESKLHEKDLEIERLRAALAKAGVDQSVVPPCEQVSRASQTAICPIMKQKWRLYIRG